MPGEVVDRWNAVLERFEPSASDVYYTEEYARLYEGDRATARCFVQEEGDEAYLMPYLEHPNAYLEGRHDVSTPYGYGGPISTTSDPAFVGRASSEMRRLLAERGAVAGFARCHPLLSTERNLGDGWDASVDRKTVGVDFRAVGDIWTEELDTKARNRVRHSLTSGAECAIDGDLSTLDEFVDVYHDTMRLVGAKDFYYFPRGYFEQLKERFPGRSYLSRVTINGTLAAGVLVLCDGVYAHAHLSGSLKEHRPLGTNDLAVYRAIAHAQELGCSFVHLGGGYSSDPDDTLLRFKSHFGRRRFDFRVARTVFDAAAFADAEGAWRRDTGGLEEPAGRFPPYGLGSAA